MKIEFNRTRELAEQAMRERLSQFPFVKNYRRYGVAVLSLMWLLVLLAQNHWGQGGKFEIAGVSCPLAAQTMGIVMLVPFAVLFGFLTYLLSKRTATRWTVAEVKRTPDTNFCKVTIELTEDSLFLTSDLFESRINWRLVSSPVVTKGFLFFGKFGWVPLSACGDTRQQEAFVKWVKDKASCQQTSAGDVATRAAPEK